MSDDDGQSAQLDDDLLKEVRTEIDRSAYELHRLTERVNEQSITIERLELLVTEVLELLPASAVVVDADGLIAAVSRGARECVPGLTHRAIGQPVTSALPARLGSAILMLAHTRERPPEAVKGRSDKADEPTRWVDVEDAQVVALPGGWALVVMSV